MKTSEKVFDFKMVSNLIIALAIGVAGLFYYTYSNEIEEQVNTAITNSLHDVNRDLAEQDSGKK